MVAFMTLTLFAMLFSISAFADESEIESTTPTVSLAWDTNTVTVIDGVAKPHKNASATASSYTMRYTVTASGTITTTITVRIQSFNLSAIGGQEYATVDTTVRLTEQNPTATGEVTVYTHNGYATRIESTGEVYTNEFGLRITEITNAKKQSGADTLRSQVLAKNGLTLNVKQNQTFNSYGNGTGTFPQGYVYSDMARTYTGSISSGQIAEKATWTYTLNPYSAIEKDPNSQLKTLLRELLVTLYFNGNCEITSDQDGKRNGLTFTVTELLDGTPGVEVATNDFGDNINWKSKTFNWDVKSGLSDNNLGEITCQAYSRGVEFDSDFIVMRLDEKSSYKLKIYNKEDSVGYKSKKYAKINYAVMAAVTDEIGAWSYRVEDRVYGAGDTIYMTVHFGRPVQVEHDDAHPLQIQAKIGSSTANYFTYCGGNMTSTLIFKMTLPEDRGIHGDNIELIDFVNEDYNRNIGDLCWNRVNKNNIWEVDKSKIEGEKLVCTVDTRTPDINILNISGNSGIVKSGSFQATVSSITNQGKIDIAWTKEETPPTAQDAWSSVTFSANGDDRTTVNIEKKGLTGVYYAHLRATSISGNQAITTVGPFSFDNQSPTISNLRLTDGDNAQKYLREHTLLFNISDVSIGVDKVYMKARHTNEDKGLAGGANELLIYDSTSASNILSITGEIAKIPVNTEMLDLGANSYDAYVIGFYAVDKLGNQSDLCEFADALMFDNRNTFTATLATPSDISIKGKQIYYNQSTLTFTHAESGSNTWKIESLSYNGIDVTDKLSENGITATVDDSAKSYTLNLNEKVQGYIEIVFKLNGERESNVINFYITGREENSPNYQKLYAPDRLLINEVWQLSTATFYSGNNRNGAYYTGTNTKPIFSSREKALDYAKFFEKQDIVIEYIDDEVEKNNLEGGWLSNYRKAQADSNKVVAVGQTWIRYKSSSWTLGSNNEEHWVYYFYSNEKVTTLDPLLTDALNAAIERNAKLICNYDGNNRIYLTANNTSKGYMNSYSEPYYDERGILKEALSYKGAYSYDLILSADNGIYDSFITYNNGQDVPLVANYTFKIDSAQHGFIYCRQHGTEEWLPIANGESFKDKLTASGLYEICEFGNGYMTYLVYVDLDAPVVSYELTVDGVSQNGHITSATSGGTLRASGFTVNELLNSVYGALPVERDRWAYFYVLYNSLGGGEHAFMTMTDLNRAGYEFETGIYKIYACDRLGNMTVQTIKINTEDIKVTGTVSASGLTVTSNRSPSDIMSGSFKVWRDNMLLTDVIYAQSMSFTQSGVYRIEFEDVYGNTASETYTFMRDLPTVSFSREKREGTGIYEQISVNEEDGNKLSSVISEDNQLFTVSTSANIRISYPVSSGYNFEFIGGDPEYKTSIISSTNIDIKSTSKNWTLKIFYKDDPNVYILITCIVDKDAPVISATVFADEYTYNDQIGDKDNVLFTPTGNTASSAFHSGDRVVGNSAVISWADQTRVANLTYTYNGNEKIALNPSVGSVTLTEKGKYVFEAEDVFGNKTAFDFELTDHIDFEFIIDGKVQQIEYDPERYINGKEYKQTLYTVKETQLVLKENALLAFYYTDGTDSFIYNLEYEVKNGQAILLISAYDDEIGELVAIENGDITLAAKGKVFENDIAMSYTYQNGILTLILPACQMEYELWQLRISDFTAHSPVIIQVERSNKVSEMELSREDGTNLDLSYVGFVGSNQKLFLRSDSVSDDTEEIIAYYSATYTEKFENTEKIILYGNDAVSSLEREGYYKIIATNKYGNERVIYVALSFRLSLDVHIEYSQTGPRVQTLNTPNDYSIYSNKAVSLVIWDSRASVTCTKNGKSVDPDVQNENGYLGFSLTDVGEYTVVVSDECGNTYTLSVSLKSSKTLEYDGFVTGFNENALKKDENYTNGALSIDKEKLDALGVKYVAYRIAGDEELTVIYDAIDLVPVETDLDKCIGNEDGCFEILFCDVYGNLHVETVKVSRVPMISIERQTQDAVENTDYELDFALDNGAWSNYSLTFINSSKAYSLKVDGKEASFEEGRYTFVLPTSLGAASEAHALEYTDEYGNSYNITVHLYRAVPESEISDGAETVTSDGKQYVKSDFSMLFDNGITATYSLDGNGKIDFDQSTVFAEDGEYTMTFTDYAGNTSTRIIIRDANVLYDMSSDGFILYDGAVVSSKVTLSPDEELTFTVTKDGEDYSAETRNFTEDGSYVVTLTDRLGNVSVFKFTIYEKAKQSFTFTAPDGYTISQIWYIADGHRISLVSDVVLNEEGAQTYAFSTDGEYEVELLHTQSNQICYFSLTVDNIPPKATLVGAKDGEVTRSNVSVEGLSDGDMIYLYKDGELVTTYIVNGNSETTLELLGNGDFGKYTVVIEDEAGNSVSYEFEKQFATNTFSNIFICLLLVSLGVIGIIYIRFNGKVRTK